MTPQEIIDAYNVLTQDVQNNAATEAARVGNAQRSLGVMAERVANPSGQTSGLANYTYNRTMRPAVEQATTALVTQGKAQAMQRYLSDELMKAKNAYENAKNRYQVASTSAAYNSNSRSGGGSGISEDSIKQFSGREAGYSRDANGNKVPAQGAIISTGSTKNGDVDVIIADGKGGYTKVSYFTNDRNEAKQRAVRDGYATGVWNSETLSIDSI